MKNVPVGVENYLDALKSYYVDKTLIIKDIIDFGMHKSLLITRPRRFGKSLTLSMIEHFFTIEQDNTEAFRDKKIFAQGDEYTKHIHSRSVIRINLKDVYSNDYKGLCIALKDAIASIYRKFDFLLTSPSLLEGDRRRFLEIRNEEKEELDYYVPAIRFLCECLYKHYGTKSIILIDEYDAPIEQAFENGYYDEAVAFFKRFYSHSVKGNDYTDFSLITGVLEIGKESLYSGLNNPIVFTAVDDGFMEYFGFTDDEVQGLLDHFGVKETLDTLWDNYGGYGSDKIRLYNPWSIQNFINTEIIDGYWANTGKNGLLVELFSHMDGDPSIALSQCIDNKEMAIPLSLDTNFESLHNERALFSYLVQTGYLVARRSGDGANFVLSIPNIEVKSIFEREILAKNVEGNTLQTAKKLKSALFSGDAEALSDILEIYILDTFSYFDLIGEKQYQILIAGILTVLLDRYVVKSEVNAKAGRCDIMISPKREKDVGVIIELKSHKSRVSQSNLVKSSLTALHQIKQKRYFNELMHRDCSKIIIYGFAFDRSHGAIRHEVVRPN